MDIQILYENSQYHSTNLIITKIHQCELEFFDLMQKVLVGSPVLGFQKVLVDSSQLGSQKVLLDSSLWGLQKVLVYSS